MNQFVRSVQMTDFALTPLTPTIGAEVEGLDLAKPLDSGVIGALTTALLDWKVLFFRDQPITTEQHLAFARRFGELEVHPFIPGNTEHPEIVHLTHDRDRPGRENTWHSDVTWRERPSLGSILRAVEIPPVGGDTLFADMYAAYEGLSDEVKARIDGRSAVHDAVGFRNRMRAGGRSAEEVAALEAQYPAVEHPIVRTHPQTGRKALYVNAAFTQHIVGMEADESAALLKQLYAEARVPEYQCRFRWAEHSIAFWDNRCTQHYAASDYWPAVRRMQRATIIGDRPR
ncbi:MAG TPA: TauD/TfdA family dioxygenase [Caulobacteraceae bacterium]|nr:TauD/TfdA family dioxygenase [Caulobacteraceae bacterium]